MISLELELIGTTSPTSSANVPKLLIAPQNDTSRNSTKVPFENQVSIRTLPWNYGGNLVPSLYGYQGGEECWGETMSFDFLDQETVNKLPRLSELHTAYGVQV